MPVIRTLAALGAALGREVPALAAQAATHVTPKAICSEPSLEVSIETLLDRLCLSLTLAKPVGLLGWAERESERLGRGTVMEMLSAATFVLVEAGSQTDVDRRRFIAFLDVLAQEVERATLGSDDDEDASSPAESQAMAALLAMLSERDYVTCCHSKATAEWARRLSTAMGLAKDAVEFIALCALLHDIGKVATPDAVLLKAGPLTSEEWEIMREHAAAGQRVLGQIPSLQRCSVVVRAHHERFDGAGYPDGLSGMSIPFESRVVAVADAFHAMISERPYRQPIAPRQALQILAEGRGSQWDPDVVDAMLAMFNRRAAVVPHTDSQISSA
ncbi:MAG: HD-GYP domain-containing protein [Vulcanimicrobiaceae bacterium]